MANNLSDSKAWVRSGIFPIDSAVVMPDCELSDAGLKLPEPNSEYKYAFYMMSGSFAGHLFASSNGTDWVFALFATYQEEKYRGVIDING